MVRDHELNPQWSLGFLCWSITAYSVCSTMFQEYLTSVFVLPAKVVCDLGPLLRSHSCLWRGKFDSVSGPQVVYLPWCEGGLGI